MPVQRAAEHEAQRMDRGVGVPAPGGQRHGEAEIARQPVVVGVAHRFGGDAGMQVDRHVEFFGPRQDGFESWIVQETAVGGAVYQHAMKAKVFDRAFKLVGRCVGRQQRQVREAAVARGVAGAGLGQCVVVGARQVDARLARHEVGARAGDRQHLHGDAAGVHVRQARGAELGQFGTFGGLRPDEVGAGKAAAGDRVWGNAGDDARHGVVLFQGDDAHAGSSDWGWLGGWHGGCAGATWAPFLARKNAGMPARPLVRLQTDGSALQITQCIADYSVARMRLQHSRAGIGLPAPRRREIAARRHADQARDCWQPIRDQPPDRKQDPAPRKARQTATSRQIREAR